MNQLTTHHAISSLLTRQDLWLGHPGSRLLNGYETGFDELNEHLPHWPDHGICEILSDGPGAGALGLLIPLLTAICCQSEQPIMLIAPPLLPNADALTALHLPPERFIWINADNAKEALWAMEQALHSGCCGVIIGWFEHLSLKAARRLQLAAEEGCTLGFCVLPHSAAGNQHPLPLKLALHSHNDGVELKLLKRRGGWPVSDIHIADLAIPMLRRIHLARARASITHRSDIQSVDRGKASLVELSQLVAANDRHQPGVSRG